MEFSDLQGPQLLFCLFSEFLRFSGLLTPFSGFYGSQGRLITLFEHLQSDLINNIKKFMLHNVVQDMTISYLNRECMIQWSKFRRIVRSLAVLIVRVSAKF